VSTTSLDGVTDGRGGAGSDPDPSHEAPPLVGLLVHISHDVAWLTDVLNVGVKTVDLQASSKRIADRNPTTVA
jgi:hypothetical protein